MEARPRQVISKVKVMPGARKPEARQPGAALTAEEASGNDRRKAQICAAVRNPASKILGGLAVAVTSGAAAATTAQLTSNSVLGVTAGFPVPALGVTAGRRMSEWCKDDEDSMRALDQEEEEDRLEELHRQELLQQQGSPSWTTRLCALRKQGALPKSVIRGLAISLLAAHQGASAKGIQAGAVSGGVSGAGVFFLEQMIFKAIDQRCPARARARARALGASFL